ncbi:unnamed protein product [Toxocara canis]|uniref:Uncharacterized protein n=1 Tax=Toxocara canis TaxID=6265 RepID=A0A183UF95_TOXCA|nr:unnamed protein product [Toxocara canis]
MKKIGIHYVERKPTELHTLSPFIVIERGQYSIRRSKNKLIEGRSNKHGPGTLTLIPRMEAAHSMQGKAPNGRLETNIAGLIYLLWAHHGPKGVS